MGEERQRMCLQDMVTINPKSLNFLLWKLPNLSFCRAINKVRRRFFFLQTHPRFSEIKRKRKIISSQSKAN